MKDISGALSYFVNRDSSFDDPFDETPVESISSSQIKAIIDDADVKRAEKKKKKKNKDKLAKIIEKNSELVDRFADDRLVDEFDDFIANYLVEDEDVALKNSLISLGRKYARDTKVSGEMSDIVKSYSGNEKILNDLLHEIDKDKNEVQKDITSLRLARTRNYKVLSELIEAKAQFHQMALNVVKELNSMKKTQYELQLKSDKGKTDADNIEISSNRAIQNLFSLGRGTLVDAVGGISSIAGAIDDNEISKSMNDDYGIDEDEIIQKKYFPVNDEETDGDKFLKYEGRGVEYVLLIDEEGNKNVIAEDNEGNIIPDYPIPQNIDSLNFDISDTTGTATDDYNRQYKVRRI